MVNDWRKYTIEEVCTIKYGKDHKKLDEGSIPVYGTGGIMRYVDSLISDCKSVLIPRKGSLNNIYYVDHPFWTVDTLFWTQIKEDLVLPKYFYYNLKTVDFASKDVGSAVPSLTTSLLNRLEVDLPPLPEQKAIASILSALDDKIELNLQMNKTLEEMAMALYKHWFVDFGPFQDQNFVDSELGMIPEGWEVKRLGDIVSYQKGFAFKAKWYQKEGVSIVRVSDTTHNSINIDSCNKIPHDLAEDLEKYALKTDDVIIATVGSWPPNYASVVGKVIRVPLTATNALLNQNAVKLNLNINNKRQQGLLYLTLKNARFLNYIVNGAQGSANQASIKLTDIFNYAFPIGDHEKLKGFFGQVDVFFKKQNILIVQNQTLKEVRDLLLPKLISGEVRLKEFQKTVEQVL